MQLTRERGRPAEEDAHVRVGMLLSDAREYTIPVRPAKVRWGAQRSDRIFVSADVLDDDIGHVIFFDFRC